MEIFCCAGRDKSGRRLLERESAAKYNEAVKWGQSAGLIISHFDLLLRPLRNTHEGVSYSGYVLLVAIVGADTGACNNKRRVACRSAPPFNDRPATVTSCRPSRAHLQFWCFHGYCCCCCCYTLRPEKKKGRHDADIKLTLLPAGSWL